MSYLNTDLKIFEFDDGEQHWIVAKNQEDAIQCYTDIVDSEEGYEYEIKEIFQDSKEEINIVEDDELLAVVNKYKNVSIERTESIPIWLFLKYLIVEQELRGNEFRVPNLIGSTAF